MTTPASGTREVIEYWFRCEHLCGGLSIPAWQVDLPETAAVLAAFARLQQDLGCPHAVTVTPYVVPAR